ncbi:MAG: hypothetical protein IPK24_22850 [Kineosporiaceae bacterium]|nr:hypothetical protein [Kineosporiaceae bacterium]MBK8078304.1 hypothetical protein [Kineosporiaceae bacterium]
MTTDLPDPAVPDSMSVLTAHLNQLPRRHWAGRIRDPHFGHPTLPELQQLHLELGAGVRRHILDGAPVHRRLPTAIRQLPWVVAVLDWVVLFTFCGDIFNVAMLQPLQTPLRALAAFMLALLGSGVGYTWLAMTGIRLKSYRTVLGEIAWRGVGASTWFMVAVSIVLVGALTVLMYLRVSLEVLSATESAVAVWAGTLGALFAALSAVANLAVIAVHALDGSVAMAELERAGLLLHRYEQLSGIPGQVGEGVRSLPVV